MDKIHEPKNGWGGDWTELKLKAFENYVNAYLKIMNSQKDKYGGWPTTIYFDGFAGSGNRSSSNGEKKEDLFGDYFVEKESDVYKGSAERVLGLSKKFDFYYFVDNDRESINSLEDRLRKNIIVNENCIFICNDVNNQLEALANFINSQKAALVMLDPFGMQLNWTSIEKLKNKRVDLWILIPSGVIINRFLDRKGKLIFSNKLQMYFGMTEEKIKEIFYTKEVQDTLFGEVNIIKKAKDAVNKIAELYIRKLKTIFKNVSHEPLILYNTKNVPIYHFVFASNNEAALKIASQIIEKKNNK